MTATLAYISFACICEGQAAALLSLLGSSQSCGASAGCTLSQCTTQTLFFMPGPSALQPRCSHDHIPLHPWSVRGGRG